MAGAVADLGVSDGVQPGLVAAAVVAGQGCVFIFMFIWLRGTLPRLRYDQFMQFGWKVLIPVSIAWIMMVATFRGLRNHITDDVRTLSFVAVGAVVVVFVVSYLIEGARERALARAEAAEQAAADGVAATPGRHPVPPMPGETFEYTPRARRTVASAVAADDSQEAPRA